MNRLFCLLTLFSLSAGAVGYPAPQPVTDTKVKQRMEDWLAQSQIQQAKRLTCQGEYTYAQFPLAPAKATDEALSGYLKQRFALKPTQLYSTTVIEAKTTVKQFTEALATSSNPAQTFFFHLQPEGKLLETFSCHVKHR